MAIQYPVAPRTILLCDYAAGGFKPPEMVKRRPAVVLSPRLPHRDGLCAVVPLSTTAPERSVAYVVRLNLATPLPAPFDAVTCWAKCDLVATVGFFRLDLFHTSRGPEGKRRYLHPKLDEEQFAAVRSGVLAGLGFA